jgi:hypothetical protein
VSERTEQVAVTAAWHVPAARGLDRLPVTLVLPAHGPPAPDGPDVIRRALERPPWTPPGSG